MRHLLVLLIILFSQYVKSQSFEGSLVLGINAAQIDGDDLAGYKKIGLTGGARISYNLNKKWHPSIEFLYSQRGSRNNIVAVGGYDVHIDLKYIEIPLLFSYKDWLIPEDNYYKVRAEGGFSYARNLSKFSSEDALGFTVENIKDNDLSIILGFGYNFSNKFGLGFRYTRSLILLYKNETTTAEGLLGYFLTCRAEYQF